MTLLIIKVQNAFRARGIRAHGLRQAEVVMTVHDSLAWEVIEEQAEESAAIVKECLHEVYQWASDWMLVPLVLDQDIGTVWDQKS